MIIVAILKCIFIQQKQIKILENSTSILLLSTLYTHLPYDETYPCFAFTSI